MSHIRVEAVDLAGNTWHKKDARPTAWTDNRFSEAEKKLFRKASHCEFPHIHVIGGLDASHFLHVESHGLSDYGLISNAAMDQRNDSHCLLRDAACLTSFGLHDQGN